MRRKRHLLQIAEKSIQRVWYVRSWSGRNGGDRPLEALGSARRRDACRGMAHVGIVAPRRDDTVIRGGAAREETRSYLSNTSPLRAMTTSIVAATVTPGRDPADYDDDALDRLAELIADRVAARLGGLTPGRSQPEPLVDAAEIARLHGKTRSWVYEHAGELGAVRLGSGPRPRLAFSRARRRTAREGRQAYGRPTPEDFSASAPPRAGRAHRVGRAAAACAIPRNRDRRWHPRGHQRQEGLARPPGADANSAIVGDPGCDMRRLGCRERSQAAY